MTDQEIVEFVINKFEGHKFTDDPDDYGGATKYGITRALFTEWKGRYVELKEIEEMTFADACACAREMFMMRTNIWQIPDWRLKFVVFDYSFNAGSDDGIPALQRAVGVPAAKVDARLGPMTLAAVKSSDQKKAAFLVLAERQEVHVKRSTAGKKCDSCKTPSQRKWLGGWVNRCSTILRTIA